MYIFNRKKSLMLVFSLLFFFLIGINSLASSLSLTQEEIEYIEEAKPIKASSIDGGAPLHYKNSKGEIIGIAVSILDEIQDMTGLIFEYNLYDSIDKVFQSDTDIIFGLTHNYAPESMILSKPYLLSETILFMNSSLDPNRLEDKRYASIKGGKLPEGIKEENTLYFNSREDTLKAVEDGEADYGHGNEYSLAFYTLQKSYKNIVTIPKAKESREYVIGFTKDDPMLLSIINKSIEAIDDGQMHQIILKMATQVEPDLTLSMIFYEYWKMITAIFLAVISLLLWGVLANIKAKKELSVQNRRYELLSRISNEYLFEYNLRKDQMRLSEKSLDLFGKNENLKEVKEILKDTISEENYGENISIVNLPLANKKIGIFKKVNSIIYDEKNHMEYIIGKLTNVSEEVAEKEKLIIKTQMDGLTGIYNATTTRKLICDSITNKDYNGMDALLIIDGDKFKNINDTFGHLAGDQALKNISKALRRTFRETDIIGRVGGDEFAVYMKNIPSAEFVKEKADNLIKMVQKMDRKLNLTVSIGIAYLRDEKSDIELFKKADEALYEAKRTGRGRTVSL